MMKKFYDKSELWFALAWIIGYCLLASIGDNLSAEAGLQKVFTLPILIVLSVAATVFVTKNRLHKKYGLCRSRLSAAKLLYYIPLLIMLTVNLWYGVAMNLSPLETVLYVLSMFCVGFLEEVIFRGLLFQAMAKDGVKSAIIVSSVTFGIGHIVNLINGSGAELLPNLLQVIYAMVAGFLFVMIFYKTKSLVPCIITHGFFNALSVFSNETVMTSQRNIISCLFMVLISGTYALYIAFVIKPKQEAVMYVSGKNDFR
jgi:membrane protease YdiL (CAAX protease family)